MNRPWRTRTHRGKHEGANKGNQSRALHLVMTECPGPPSHDPRMVLSAPMVTPVLINSIRYPSKHKHCSQHPSSSGQSTLLIYSLLLCWFVFPFVPRIPLFVWFCIPILWPLAALKVLCSCMYVCDTVTFIAWHLGLADTTRVNSLCHKFWSD